MSEQVQAFSIPAYDAELQSIVNRPLTAETIDTYADTALNDLVELVDDATTMYDHQPTVRQATAAGTEAAAFAYHGLGDVDTVLDHVAGKADEINRLDDALGRVRVIDSVVVPPDAAAGPIAPTGEGGYEEKNIIPRLKTALFVLSNEFGVDAHDPEQLSLTSGVLPDSSRRNVSYTLVEAPGLQRSLLVCDEEGNVTYVFDSAALAEYGTSGIELSKSELNELVQADPRVGQRLVYSVNFVPNVINALHDPSAGPAATEALERAGNFLAPPNPESILSLRGIAEFWNVDFKTVRAIAEELSDDLGPVDQYRFHRITTAGYTVEQQLLFAERFEEKQFFVEQAPEENMSASGMARAWNINWPKMVKAIDAIKEELGDAPIQRFTNTAAAGYTPRQQDRIWEHLEAGGTFAPAPPEGVLSIKSIGKMYGVGMRRIQAAIEDLGEELGTVNRYKFGPTTANGYQPEQQELILRQLGK